MKGYSIFSFFILCCLGLSAQNHDPLTFNFINKEGKNIVYVDTNAKNKGQEMRIKLCNTAEKPLLFKPIKKLSLGNFHFLLIISNFKSQYFSKETLKNIRMSKADSLLYEMKIDISHPSSPFFFFRIKDVNNYKIDTSTCKYIVLKGFKAEAQKGAISNVDLNLSYQKAYYPGSKAPFSGYSSTTINIKSYGLENLPLKAGLLGVQSILNNGNDPNELVIGLENVALLHPLVRPTDSIHFKKNTQLIISFPLDPQTKPPWKYPWALTTQNQFGSKGNGIKLNTDSTRWNYSKTNNAFVLQPKKAFSLAPAGVIRFSFTDIISPLPDGQTYINIHYQHIPGYSDGYFSIPVTKSNLYVERGKVSIGMKPTSRFPKGNSLEVNGGVFTYGPYPLFFNYSDYLIPGLLSMKAGELSLSAMYLTNDSFQIFRSTNPRKPRKSLFGIDRSGNVSALGIKANKQLISGDTIFAKAGNPPPYGASNTGFTFPESTYDKATGMYSSSGGELAFYIQNIKRMAIDSSGQLIFNYNLSDPYPAIYMQEAIYAKGGNPESKDVGYRYTSHSNVGMANLKTGELALYNGAKQMIIDKSGMITYAKKRAVSGSAKNGEKIPVPYGATDDWLILISLREFCEGANKNSASSYINTLSFEAVANYGNKSWQVSCTAIGSLSYKDCSVNYLLIKK